MFGIFVGLCIEAAIAINGTPGYVDGWNADHGLKANSARLEQAYALTENPPTHAPEHPAQIGGTK